MLIELDLVNAQAIPGISTGVAVLNVDRISLLNFVVSFPNALVASIFIFSSMELKLLTKADNANLFCCSPSPQAAPALISGSKDSSNKILDKILLAIFVFISAKTITASRIFCK